MKVIACTYGSLECLDDLLHTLIDAELTGLEDQLRLVWLLVLLVNTSEA